MTLTDELADPHSPISRWFRLRFPNLEPLARDWEERLALVNPPTLVPPVRRREQPDWALLGTAIGYRVGFAFAGSPPYAALHAIGALTGDYDARHAAASVYRTHRSFPLEGCADLRPLPDGRVLELRAQAPVSDRQPDADLTRRLLEFFAWLAAFVDAHPRVNGR